MEESPASSSNRRLDLLYETLKKSRGSDKTAVIPVISAVDDALDPLACETERTKTNDTRVRHKSVLKVGWRPISNVRIASYVKHSITNVVMYSVEVSLARDGGNNRNGAVQDSRYNVWRRYSHFRNAFAYLMQCVPDHGVPDFSKQLFPSKSFVMSTSSLLRGYLVVEDELRLRQEELELWLKAIVNYANEDMVPSSMYGDFHARLRLEIQAFLSPAAIGDIGHAAPPRSVREGGANSDAAAGSSRGSGASWIRARSGIGFINAVDRSGEEILRLQTGIETEVSASQERIVSDSASGSFMQLLSKTLSDNNASKISTSRAISDERDDLIDNYFAMNTGCEFPNTETKNNSASGESIDKNVESISSTDDDVDVDVDDDVFSEVDSTLLYRTLSLFANLPIIRGLLLDNDSDVHGAHEDDGKERYVGM